MSTTTMSTTIGLDRNIVFSSLKLLENYPINAVNIKNDSASLSRLTQKEALGELKSSPH